MCLSSAVIILIRFDLMLLPVPAEFFDEIEEFATNRPLYKADRSGNSHFSKIFYPDWLIAIAKMRIAL